ncbi:MAG: hypothetical protein KKA19_04650 [Candidatus Margulisbacteria bacterium]|nr:hypothetical protein [Candidatus Margulisiibacteriota bacterium]
MTICFFSKILAHPATALIIENTTAVSCETLNFSNITSIYLGNSKMSEKENFFIVINFLTKLTSQFKQQPSTLKQKLTLIIPQEQMKEKLAKQAVEFMINELKELFNFTTIEYTAYYKKIPFSSREQNALLHKTHEACVSALIQHYGTNTKLNRESKEIKVDVLDSRQFTRYDDIYVIDGYMHFEAYGQKFQEREEFYLLKTLYLLIDNQELGKYRPSIPENKNFELIIMPKNTSL